VLIERRFHAAGAVEEEVIGVHDAILEEVENTACRSFVPELMVVLMTAALRPNSAPKVERWILNS